MSDHRTNQFLPADRCWYCGRPFADWTDPLATAQNAGGPSVIRWVCRDGAACHQRLTAARKKHDQAP